LIGDSADFRLEITDTRVTLTLGLIGGRQLTPEGADFAAAVIFRMLRDLSQGSARPIAVELPRDKPRRASMYQRFFGVPVSFGAPMPKLEYESACMHAPFSQQDRRLVELLSQHAAALVKNIVPPASDAWQERVRAVIADGLVRGDCALDRVAWRCGVGERTLRRRLADAGTSYRALVDDVRKERALEWLDGPGSVTVVAQRLGFSDATAFARAFRRWTGVPPHEHVHRTRSS
jgi:AraC-like DNA-binding protein